jgi:hypothetical protein
MKKLSTFIIVVIVTLLTSYSAFSNVSYFSNDKALNSIFTKLEKEFLQYKRDEVIPLKNLGAIITDPNQPRIPRTSKKISDSQVNAATQKALNDIRVAIEIKEEALGGLTPQDYKTIIDHFNEALFFAKNSQFGWDYDGKYVQLYFTAGEDHEWGYINNLTGNFTKMGKEKDEVNPDDLRVKDKIVRYFNQAIQKGNKISPEVLEKFPGEVERLFIEYNLSRIEAATALSRIHEEIYSLDTDDLYDQYDGSESIESLVESCDASISNTRHFREQDKEIEYYQYREDEPSSKNKETITTNILRDNLPESFTYGFSKAVTLDELAQLYFGSKELSDKIVIEDPSFDANTPDYIKQAFAYGLIHDLKDLNKPLTRLEAARSLVNGAMYHNGFWNALSVTDAAAIPLADQITVATCLHAYMKPIGDKFEPQSSYTKEQAILDEHLFYFKNIRGYNIPVKLGEISKVVLGKNTINILFENKDAVQAYIDDRFDDTVLSKIKTNKSYTKIDTGGALIELFTPENGIKFTMKNDVTYFDLQEGVYGPGLAYKLEPVVLKGNEKVDMNTQIDSIHKKLYAKLDPILAKIIKPGMTQEQKVKAIHDFVIKHITYDTRYRNVDNLENLMISIDKGRGVCGDYSLLFMHLCRRASIPSTYEVGDPETLDHAWNAVYLNGQWLFVDTTWDDNDSGKILYTHYLKDRFAFMSGHTPYMGVPDPDYYIDIDPMNIKTQDELRAYLLEEFYWVNGYKLTFRMTDKNIKPIIGYMRDAYVTIQLTYDSKNDLYTVAAKAR